MRARDVVEAGRARPGQRLEIIRAAIGAANAGGRPEIPRAGGIVDIQAVDAGRAGRSRRAGPGADAACRPAHGNARAAEARRRAAAGTRSAEVLRHGDRQAGGAQQLLRARVVGHPSVTTIHGADPEAAVTLAGYAAEASTPGAGSVTVVATRCSWTDRAAAATAPPAITMTREPQEPVE